MLTHVLVGKKKIRINPTKAIGKGGEADIYDIGNGDALKLYKPPDHPDYEGLPHEQDGARRRIVEHQKKLRQFPHDLPNGIVVPKELATDLDGKRIVGYVLKFVTPAELLIRYSEKAFRETGVPDSFVVKILESLHGIVWGAHKGKFVIGDFNDLNVLVRGEECHLIDADSGQFGEFLCRVFTGRFVDPLLCDPNAKAPLLVKPHNELSDWYAYAVMFMQCLLFVGPYGGVYRPANKLSRIPHDMRPLKRVTVFNTEVIYPKPARPLDTLPDGVLSYLQELFAKDKREPFPETLFEKLQFDPAGNLLAVLKEAVAPARVTEVITGTVTASKIFTTSGRILYATVQSGTIRYFYHENGVFFREGGTEIFKGFLDPQMRYRIGGKKTVVAKGKQAFIFNPGVAQKQLSVESYGQLSLIDANEQAIFYIENGAFNRIGSLGTDYPEHIGDVLSNQTLFWVGAELGFGFYRAGNLCQYFVFFAKSIGINDSVKLPPLRGQLVDSTCVFGDKRIWFFISTRESGTTINRCYLIDEKGVLIASAEVPSGEDHWLGTMRGKCASGKMLLAATDDGVVRIEANGTQIQAVKTFPDTARFVDSDTHLFPTLKGLMATKANREIWNLQIK